MATVIEELVTLLGFENVGEADIRSYQDSVKKTTDLVVKLSKAAAVLGTGMAALVTVTNRETRRQVELANSVGISADALAGMTAIAGKLGFEADNVVDLVEEMNNKIGESTGLGEAITPVAESFQILGLEFDKISKMTPEDQFMAISDAIQTLPDKQAAVSAADMLFGGEANKFFGMVRNGEMSIRQMTDAYKQASFETKRSRDGAVAYASALGSALGVIGTMRKAFAGLVGEGLVPVIEEFRNWVAANREVIKSNIEGFAKAMIFLIKALGVVIMGTVQIISNFVDIIGGAEFAVKLLAAGFAVLRLIAIGQFFIAAAGAVATFVTALGGGITIMNLTTIAALAMQAAVLLIPLAVGAAVAAAVLLLQDLYAFFTGGESVIGDFVNWITSMIPRAFEFVGEAILKAMGPLRLFFDLGKAAFGVVKNLLGLSDDIEVNQNVQGNLENGPAGGAGTNTIAASEVAGNVANNNNVDQSQSINAQIVVSGGADRQAGRDIADGLNEQSRRLRRNTTGALAY